MRENDARIREQSKSILLMWAQPCIQYVLNVRRSKPQDWKELVSLSGEFMDEVSFIRQVIEANHLTLLSIVWTYKCILAASFGFWTDAESIFRDTIALNDTVHFTYGALTLYFFGSLSHYSLYLENRNKKHLRAARKYQRLISKFHKRGNKNVLIYLTLLKAEELSLKTNSKRESVMDRYREAIDVATLMGITHHKALTHERAGFFLARSGMYDEAKSSFDISMNIYLLEWGSIADYESLRERSERVLKPLAKDRKNIVDRVIGLQLHEVSQEMLED
jgi:hypothetical protein